MEVLVFVAAQVYLNIFLQFNKTLWNIFANALQNNDI